MPVPVPVPDAARTGTRALLLACVLTPTACTPPAKESPPEAKPERPVPASPEPAPGKASTAQPAPTKQAAATWTREQELCHHTAQFVESRKITVDDWHRICLAMMGPMKRSFTPPQWERFAACVLADRMKDAMETCEAEIRREAATAKDARATQKN